MTRVAEPGAQFRWLAGESGRASAGGYDLAGWEASTFVLHSMYENASLENLGTHDDLYRGQAAAAEARGSEVDEWAPDPVDEATGVSDGRLGEPGPPWQRLRWADVARRRGHVLSHVPDWLPSAEWLYGASWPVSVLPPTDGSLLLDDLDPLLDILAKHSPGGAEAPYFAYYCELVSDDMAPVLWSGPLGAIAQLTLEHPRQYSPNNFWPHDRSVFCWTDHDLSGTKVSGRRELIADLEAHPYLETVQPPP